MQTNPFRRHLPIIALIVLALAVGIAVLPHYGESWDEADIRRYSDYAGGAYAYFFHPADLPEFETNLNFYGPGYFVVAGLLARGIHALIPAESLITAWHAVYFFTFLIGVLLLYLLALRFLSPWGAFGASVLFVSQPLFWGHAFMNPKDLPFLTIFLAAVFLGLRMTDRIEQRGQPGLLLPAAAALLGFTSSMRIPGPLAGVLVLGWAGWRLRKRALAPAILYVFIAAVSMYVFWPYLWGAPVGRFLNSFHTMADFPFRSDVLFAGQNFKAGTIPPTYVPTLLGIQLTEPAVGFIVAGFVLGLKSIRRPEVAALLCLFGAWFLLPVALVIAARVPLYDNARQLYFLLPPLFLVAGICFDRLFDYLPRPALRLLVVLLAALPGLLVGARLHPYEYTYYNAFVGGTGGAFRLFETDYWGTSFEDMTTHVNSNLPSNARLLVYGPEQIVAAGARKDLMVFIPRENTNPGYDYVILLTRSNADQRLCRDTEPIYSVGRRGAIFSELRSIPDGARCQ